MRTKKKANPAPESVAASAATEGDHQRPQVQELGLTGEGVERIQIDALDEAIRDYVKYRDARISKGMEEKKNKKLVLALMEKHNLGSYTVDDVVCVRKPKDETESIKVINKADYTGNPQQTTMAAGGEPTEAEEEGED